MIFPSILTFPSAGSVNGSNCADLATQEDIDGFLVGGASLKVSFCTLDIYTLLYLLIFRLYVLFIWCGLVNQNLVYQSMQKRDWGGQGDKAVSCQ